MKAYIVSKADKADTGITEKLYSNGIAAADGIADCDIVITIGGDGTILQAGKEAAKAGKPLLGINTGRLGFMATLEKDGVSADKLLRLVRGDYSVSRRMSLDIQIGGAVYNALNDIVLHRNDRRLPDFRVFRGDTQATEILKIRADGMIVSTPTGSTAYSLSAGGPIIEPESECFLVTALCPHTLFNRAMVFSPVKPLKLQAADVSVSIDGHLCQSEGGEIVITKSLEYLDLIDIDGNSFYNSIHNKLMKPLK